MSAGNWFWIIYVLALLLGGGWVWRSESRSYAIPGLVIWLLVGLLGWRLFGPPLQ